MVSSAWSDELTRLALDRWATYQEGHDLSERIGQTAGIDPSSDRVWFGESAAAIAEELGRQGLSTPLYFIRVGFDHYVRKGVHR